jgi:ATP-dependent Lon protease
MTMQLDALDKLAATAFDGYLVRKDLVRRYSRMYPVPTYVVEFLLGRYCASVDENEINEGLEIVEKQLKDRTVRTGDEELFKARARELGSVRVIDIVRARLDAKNDCYLAELPSLALRDVRIEDTLVRENERMLTDGFYAEVTLAYDGVIAQQQGGRPFKIDALRPIQMSKADVLDVLAAGRRNFALSEWISFLLRSVGLEPDALTDRAKKVTLLRMVPFVERNYNLVELGPRGTGKSHLYQQISPYAHLISGGKATVAKMFVNNATGQRGLVCQYDVVCFDEVSGISFDQKDGVNIMKGYMASGQFSRGKENIRAEGSLVMVGNLDVDVEQQQKIGHLLSPLPPEMRNDTAFMDRLHAYVPGWDFPKLNPNEHVTDHFGLVSDFLSECWSRLRAGNRVSVMQGRIHLGGALSGRDIEAVTKTVSGLTKLLFPDPEMPISDEDLEWMTRLALEARRRVKEQQKKVFKSEFRNTHFSYILGPDGVEQFVSTPELHSDEAIESDPLPPGQVWAVSPGTGETGPGLYRLEVTCGPGSGVKVLNQPTPPSFRESVKIGEQNLYTRAKDLVGDRNPREEEFSIQMRAMDSDKSGSGLGLPVLVALCGSTPAVGPSSLVP